MLAIERGRTIIVCGDSDGDMGDVFIVNVATYPRSLKFFIPGEIPIAMNVQEDSEGSFAPDVLSLCLRCLSLRIWGCSSSGTVCFVPEDNAATVITFSLDLSEDDREARRLRLL